MSLSIYNRKRDFRASPEPRGSGAEAAAKQAGGIFVVQKHAARRLHYDLRLEMGGVLKSWAVTRGPSLVPSEKRLAVHVEDHPLDYGDFEGIIPKGHYGAGEVLLWDRGAWSPIGDPVKGYRKGHLEFELEGRKLSGRWHLVRMGEKGEGRENWLLIKGDDTAARSDDAPDILEERPESVKSGQTIEALAGKPKRASRKNSTRSNGKAGDKPQATDAPAAMTEARRADLPDFVEPALATLVKTVPAGDEWLHEIKLDGYRLQARIENGAVRLLTRTGLDWTARFGADLAAALARLPLKAGLIDGELVVETGGGISDFSLLQADLSEGRTDRFVFYAFDLMHLDGFDLTRVALRQRKARLKALVEGADASQLRFSEDFAESGSLVLKHACRLSLEGIVSKRADSIYRSGRGRNWVKSKCTARQELVIGGYMPSSVEEKAIGSLLMGTFDDKGGLVYAGKVGTGYDLPTARRLFALLEPMRQAKSPFTESLTPQERRDAVFVAPDTVAEIEFRGFTADRRLRHASFRGLREDKAASEVRLEEPMTQQKAEKRQQKRTVTLTHPDRVYWPDAGVTKAGLADYYQQVWPLMAAFIIDRPLALLRCPEGIDGQRFFQKHSWRGMRKNIVVRADPKASDGGDVIGIHDLDGLIALVQGAALEIHPWGSTFSALERPDMVNIDLDPGPGVEWQKVIDAAQEVRQRLQALGLVPFVKTSGGKGLHVVAPLRPKAGWVKVKAAMKALAVGMAGDEPDRYVATVSKAKREGRILIDYLRNGRGQTAVAPYSTRARPGAPVSMPLSWEELSPEIGPAHFTVANIAGRLERMQGDPWRDFRAAAAELKQK